MLQTVIRNPWKAWCNVDNVTGAWEVRLCHRCSTQQNLLTSKNNTHIHIIYTDCTALLNNLRCLNKSHGSDVVLVQVRLHHLLYFIFIGCLPSFISLSYSVSHARSLTLSLSPSASEKVEWVNEAQWLSRQSSITIITTTTSYCATPKKKKKDYCVLSLILPS